MKLDKTNIQIGQGTQQPEVTEEAPLEKSSTGEVTPTHVISDVPHQLFGQVANAGVEPADGGVSLGELRRDPGVPGVLPGGQPVFEAPITIPIMPEDVGVIVGRDGKLGELLSSNEAAALREKRQNFASGIGRILDNTLVLDSPRQLPLAAPSLSPERHARIAVGGFFRPPDTTDHHSVVRGFLDALVTELGDENVAFMTSATTSSGTLERLVTEVSDAWDVPTVYFTANAYLGKADTEKLPAALRPHYRAATKVVLPEKDLYGWAEMATSTALVNTGGQQAAVSDFVKAIQLGNPVVFVINRDLGPLTFDRESGKPSNGAAYVTAMLQARAEIVTQGLADGKSGKQIAAEVRDPANYPHPFMPHRNFDGDFLVDHGRDVTNLVVSFEVDGVSDLGPSAKAAAQHLRRRLGIES